MDGQNTKSVLITGCSLGGLGSALVVEFAKNPSWHVFATARDPKKLSHFSSQPNVTTLSLEVNSQESIDAAVDVVRKQTGGRLDILLNNAGRWYRGPLLDADLDDVRNIFETNVMAPLAISKAFASMLVKGQGQILMVGSTSTYFAIAWQGPYNASKAALTVMTHNLRYELAPLGVGVTCLTVGGVQTSLQSKTDPVSAHMPGDSYYAPIADVIEHYTSAEEIQKYCGPPEEVAREIVQLALKDSRKAEFWTGKLSWVFWWMRMVGLTGLMGYAGTSLRGCKQLVEVLKKAKRE